MCDHFYENRVGYITGAIFLFIFGGCGYYQFLDWRAEWQYEAAQAEEKRRAQVALDSGDPEPMLNLLRGRLASLKQRRDSIERNPAREVKINRRTGVETRKENLTSLLPGIYKDIADLESKIAKFENDKRQRYLATPEGKEAEALQNALKAYKDAKWRTDPHKSGK